MLLFPILATILSLQFHLSFLSVILLFFGVPAVYLSIRSPGHIQKSFLFALIPWFSLTFVFEYLAYTDNAWYVTNSSWRFLGGSIPIEDILWGFFWSYLPIIFWKSFLDGKSVYDTRFPNRIWWILLPLVIMNALFFSLYFIARDLLYIPYFYLIMGIIFCIIPPILFLMKYPKFLSRLLILGSYFSYLAGMKEITALSLGQWYFPGTHFVYLINFQKFRLPLEEIVFFIVLSAPSMVCFYEFFADDRK